MPRIDYNNRRFLGVVNYDEGDFNRETVFDYHQTADVVWGTFRGGGVLFGTFVAAVGTNDHLDMRWSYVCTDRTLKTGTCACAPEVLPDGRLRVHEYWTTTTGTLTEGTSVLEETRTCGVADQGSCHETDE